MSAGMLLRELLRDQRRGVAAGAASGVVWMVALAAVPLVVSRAVDVGVVGGDRFALVRWLLVLAGVTVAQVAAGGARHWLACRLHYGTTVEVSRRVTHRLLDPRGELDEHPGALVSLVTSDATRVGAIADLCCRGTGSVVAIVGVAAVMVVISPLLAGAVLAAIAVLVALSLPLLRPLERRATTEQRARSAATTATADMITGHRVLHGLGAFPGTRRRFVALNEDVRASATATAGMQAALDGLGVALPGTLLAITIAVGQGLVADGAMTVGQLVAFLAYSQFLLTPVTGSTTASRRTSRSTSPWASCRTPSSSMVDTFGPPAAAGVLDLDALRALVAGGQIDNVIVAVPDLAGRLQGSRVAADLFLEEVVANGFSACTYLLASDVEMVAGEGYRFSPWDTGFGDLVLRPAPETLRRLPWEPRTALVISDAEWADGTTVSVAPRAILQRQLNRLTERGLHAFAATELEFRVFREPYRRAWDAGYRELSPATAYNVDYALGGLSSLDPLATHLRATMLELGVAFETSRGECAPGQYEISFRYGPAMAICDGHALYKTAARAIAAQHDVSLTFMAKFDQAEGSGGHVHLSICDDMDEPLFAGDGSGDRSGMSTLMAQFVAGQLACLPDLTLLFAPNVNSYKRLRPGSFAPTNIAWGRDNRTCPIRVVGAGRSLRLEHRVPGADANPYLVLAGIIAAGLHGIEHQLELEPAAIGNVFSQDRPSLPATLEGAQRRWSLSHMAEVAFGRDIVTHMEGAALAELEAFASTVTDWERRRCFERM